MRDDTPGSRRDIGRTSAAGDSPVCPNGAICAASMDRGGGLADIGVRSRQSSAGS